MNQAGSMVVTAVGIVIAVCAAAKLPAAAGQFPSTTVVSLVGVAIALIGVVGWRRSKRYSAGDSDLTAAPNRNPFALIEGIRKPLCDLVQDASQLDCDELLSRLDSLNEAFLLPFAESRGLIVQRLGVTRGAEVIIEIALVERYLNRAWSAAADGHHPEAVDSILAANQACDLVPLRAEDGTKA